MTKGQTKFNYMTFKQWRRSPRSTARTYSFSHNNLSKLWPKCCLSLRKTMRELPAVLPKVQRDHNGRAKELTCKAHFVSSSNKRKIMGNYIMPLYTATRAVLWAARSSVSRSQQLKDFRLTTSSQGLLVWFRFRDCWRGGGTRFCFLLFTRANITQNSVNVNFS